MNKKHKKQSVKRRLRALVYVRARCDTPTETADETRRQRTACTTAAERLGATIDETFVDQGTSANDRERPGLVALRERVEADPGVRFVITSSPDRLARNATLDVEITTEFLGRGVLLAFADRVIIEGPAGALADTVQMVVRTWRDAQGEDHDDETNQSDQEAAA
jgi:DNA invertase Pin-like site-specific DNA recombinase